jgi:hypothetical protein
MLLASFSLRPFSDQRLAYLLHSRRITSVPFSANKGMANPFEAARDNFGQAFAAVSKLFRAKDPGALDHRAAANFLPKFPQLSGRGQAPAATRPSLPLASAPRLCSLGLSGMKEPLYPMFGI